MYRSLSNWVGFVFDHPVSKLKWYEADNCLVWDDSPEHLVMFIAESFERSGELLQRFSDAQVDQGLWFLLFSDYMAGFGNSAVPLSLRQRGLESFIPLFEGMMVKRCSPHLSHLGEQGANPLNSSCYMWWDHFRFHGNFNSAHCFDNDPEILNVMRRLLTIPHDACRESALHGLGHWHNYNSRASGIIEEFLSLSPDLRSELVEYAQNARLGRVL